MCVLRLMKEKMVECFSGISPKQLFIYFNFKCIFTNLPHIVTIYEIEHKR